MSRKPNPHLEQLIERLARLEEHVKLLDVQVEKLSSCIKRLDNRLWYILTGVILTVILAVAQLAL